jgi:hypothetical protein
MTVERRVRVARGDGLLVAAVALVSLLVYANSLSNGFSLDDIFIIEKNHQIHFLSNLSRFFGQDYFEPSMRMGLYRPLVISSFALTVAVAGDGPLGFHVGNVLLHAANSVLLLLLVLRLTGDRGLAAGAGLLFAAHAVHTEAVANVSFGRPELMAACFGLLALHLSISSRRSQGTRATLATAGCLAAFLLAVLSKESAASLLGVIVLIDWLYGREEASPSLAGLAHTLRSGSGRYLGLALAVAACVGLRWSAIGDQIVPPVPFVDNPLGALPAGWRVVNAALITLRYGGLLLFPWTLRSDYSYDAIPLVIDPSDSALWMGLPLLALGLAAAVWSYRHDREIFFGLAFLSLTFAAGSNLLLPIGTILGERLLYLPSAGFCVAAVRTLQRVVESSPLPDARRGAAIAAVVLLASGLHGVRAAARNPVWADDETLRLHDVSLQPRSVKLQSNAGAAFLERGEPERALAHFEAAMVSPISPAIFLNPYQGKVRALLDLGRFEQAGALYEEVIRYGPRDPEIERRLSEAVRRSQRDASSPSD